MARRLGAAGDRWPGLNLGKRYGGGELDYALHANRRRLCSNHPLFEEQFGYLNYQRQEFRQVGHPIISVDSKKKEFEKASVQQNVMFPLGKGGSAKLPIRLTS